ncbi:hypothetical protein PR202_ga14914 [Eleusine coracana subsp. coracana]|uniref:NB-ARC domain-containing protein n=1 Tax=Eleusine coracana subsp. coracana TaxID=191504 RepID=A0AAV5CIU2_ELECO|nr:hypothetical protein PR202_ga14914 [Eleusine coracana subsp. coracana]
MGRMGLHLFNGPDLRYGPVVFFVHREFGLHRFVLQFRAFRKALWRRPANGRRPAGLQGRRLGGPETDSKKLFLSTAFGSMSATYPAELEVVMGEILDKCGGVPLAVNTIARILGRYTSPGSKDKWEAVCNSLGSHMERNPTLEGMRQIITLSYKALHSDLQGYFMYCSIFPEDYVINKDRFLYRRIAEGLVKEKVGLTMLEVAESYLDQLLSRNLIMPVSFGYDEKVESFRVHDMLLEILVSESQENYFVTLVSGRLYLLRFLSLRHTNISVVPRQVEKLQQLQTFDVRDTDLGGLPKSVTKLEKLERLLFSNRHEQNTMWRLPRGLSKMKALQKYDLRRLSIGDTGTNGKKTLNFLHELSSPPVFLRHLRIAGGIDGLPAWIESLTYLVELVISEAELTGDQLFDIVHNLPNLKSIWMQQMSYRDTELVASNRYHFSSLVNLKVTSDAENPKVIRFEVGSMPNLKTLEVRFADKEKKIIGIEHLTTLKEVKLTGKKDNAALNLALEQLPAENRRRPESCQFKIVAKYE